jgi:hypothetical protein
VQRRFAEYRPVSRWRPRLADVRLFRSVRLNLAGRAISMASCLCGALMGYASGPPKRDGQVGSGDTLFDRSGGWP